MKCPICNSNLLLNSQPEFCQECGYENLWFISRPSDKIQNIISNSKAKAKIRYENYKKLQKDFELQEGKVVALKNEIRKVNKNIEKIDDFLESQKSLPTIKELDDKLDEIAKNEILLNPFQDIDFDDRLYTNNISSLTIFANLEGRICRFHFNEVPKKFPVLLIGFTEEKNLSIVSIDQCDFIYQIIIPDNESRNLRSKDRGFVFEYTLPFPIKYSWDYVFSLFYRNPNENSQIRLVTSKL